MVVQKAAASARPSFDIPSSVNQNIGSFHSKHESIAYEKEYIRFITKGRGFLGMPANDAAPKNYVMFWNAENYPQKILYALENNGIDNIFDEQDIKSIRQSLESTIFYSLCKDLKTLNKELIVSIIDDSKLRLSNEVQNIIIAEAQKIYQEIIEIFPLKTNTDKYPRQELNPSAQFSEENDEGVGSYDAFGKWIFGKQNLPAISMPFAQVSSNIVHPCHKIHFSFLKHKEIEDYFILLENKKFWVNKDGFLLLTESYRLQNELKFHIDIQVKNIVNWNTINNVGPYQKISQCDVSLLGQKNSKFKIVSITENNSCKVSLFSPSGQKIGQFDVSMNNFPANVMTGASEKLSEYIASEIAAYAYCAVHGMRVAHEAQVAPNANAWSAFRLAGGVSSAPAISIGQGALNVNSNYSYSLPTYGYNPLQDFVKTEDEEKIRIFSFVLWEDFINQCTIIEKNNKLEARHSSSGFKILSTPNIIHGKMLIESISSSGENFENFYINCTIPGYDREITLIALANLIGVKNTPSFESIGAHISLPEKILPSNTSVINHLDYPNDTFFSNKINFSSITLRKYSSYNLHGLLTDLFTEFLTKLPIQFNAIGVISSYEDLIKSSMVMHSQNINLETMRKFFNQQAITDALMKLAKINAEIPVLPKMYPDGRRTDFEKGLYCPFLIVENQNYGLTYEIKLIGEYEPEIENVEQEENMEKSFSSNINQENLISPFDKSYGFEIICRDRNGDVVIDYSPSYNTPAGYVPRLCRLDTIVNIYLPDFISWVNSYGIYATNIYRDQTSQMAKNENKSISTTYATPFQFDEKMSMEGSIFIKNWLSKIFPSINDEISFGFNQSSLYLHLMRSVSLVDYKRQDGYMPSELLKDDKKDILLRICMLFHDIGKVSPMDGGLGFYEQHHERRSAEISLTLLNNFPIPQTMKNQAVKFIDNHHIIEHAISGHYGNLDEAVQHVAKIASTEWEADFFYHMFRCDLDKFPDYGETENHITTKISEHLLTTPQEFIEYVKSYIKNSIFIPAEKDPIIPATIPNHTHPPGNKINQTLSNLTFPEFSQKTHRFVAYASSRGGKKVFEEYNPGYFEKMQLVKEDVLKNPHKSFAKEFGMSYDGATGSVLRCFYWTTPEKIPNIFSNGLRSYSGKDSRSFFATINGPIISNYQNSGIISQLFNLKNYDEARSLVVFDYHAGNVLFENESFDALDAIRKWKFQKLGPQIFSLSFDPEDMIDGSKYLMEIGYSGIIKSQTDINNQLIIGISCFDPSRVALITALNIPRGIFTGLSGDSTKLIHHKFKAHPATTLVRTSHGIDKIETLKPLPSEEIFLSNDHDFFAKIAVSPDGKKATQQGSFIWRDDPEISQGVL